MTTTAMSKMPTNSSWDWPRQRSRSSGMANRTSMTWLTSRRCVVTMGNYWAQSHGANMARRPTPMDFFAQFDDVEVRQLSVKEVEALRAMAVLDHNEFVAKLVETLDSVAIDL